MANTVGNVTAGKPKASGSIYRAPLSSTLTLPTDAVTALAAAFVCLGYVSDDGLKNEHKSDQTVKAWGGDTVLLTKKDEFKFTLIESLNPDVLKVVHGDANVSGTLSTGVTVNVNDGNEEPSAWVIEMLLNANTLKRIVIPKGKVADVGEVTYKDDDAVGYEVTISAGRDDDGNTHYEYLKTASSGT